MSHEAIKPLGKLTKPVEDAGSLMHFSVKRVIMAGMLVSIILESH